MTPRQDKREKILEAARTLFERYGAAQVGIADVAEAAGVSRQAIYLHFGDRAGLMVALVDYIDTQSGLADVFQRIFSAPSGLEMLDRVIELQPVFYPRILAVVDALNAVRHTDADAAAAWENRAQMRLADSRSIVERMRAEGSLAPEWTIDAAADVAWSFTSIEIWHDLMIERGWPADVYVRHVQAALRRVLCPSQ